MTEWWMPRGFEILTNAQKMQWPMDWDTVPGGVRGILFQKFVSSKAIYQPLMKDLTLPDKVLLIARTISDMYAKQFHDMAMALEFETGQPAGEYSTLKGWRAQFGKDPTFDINACTLWYKCFLRLHSDYRWDYESLFLKLESIIGLEVKL